MAIYSFSSWGYEGSLITIEVDLRRGIPAVDIVGLPDGAVKESRERMQAAIRNSGFDFPPERVLISLSPADIKKEGADFDLPIALAVLAQHRNLKTENILENFFNKIVYRDYFDGTSNYADWSLDEIKDKLMNWYIENYEKLVNQFGNLIRDVQRNNLINKTEETEVLKQSRGLYTTLTGSCI